MNAGTVYYWQIVAINASGAATGPIWSFTSDVAPTVAIGSPLSGATFTNPATMTLTASAADPDGTVTNVSYYSGSKLVGSATVSPYRVTWKTGIGTYTLTAVATDNNGLQTTSAPVIVKVVKK
jgi:chitinase